MFVHAFLSFMFLICGQWIATAWNLPLVAYNANKYELFFLQEDSFRALEISTTWHFIRSFANASFGALAHCFSFRNLGSWTISTCSMPQRSSALWDSTRRSASSSSVSTSWASSTTSTGKEPDSTLVFYFSVFSGLAMWECVLILTRYVSSDPL